MPKPPTPPGALQISPPQLSFGEVKVDCSGVESIEVRNVGGLPLSLGGLEPVQAPFALSAGELPATLEAGQSAYLSVVFSPSTPGPVSSSLSILAETGGAVAATVPITGTGVVLPPGPVDLVFVVDVSTTMDDEMDALDRAMLTVWDRIEAVNLDVRIGLTTFVNDVIVHRSAAWLDRTAFFAELESQLTFADGRWFTNYELQRNLDNYDMPENVLDALYRSVDEFAWRSNTSHQFVLMTDDTFLEPPAIFTGDHPAQYSYDNAALRMLQWNVVLHAFHSLSEPAGFSEPYNGKPTLVEMTQGTATSITELVDGSVDLTNVLLDLVERQCPP